MMNQFGVLLTAMPEFATRAANFFHAVIVVLIALSTPAAAVMAIWFTIKWYTADDNDKPAAAKRIKIVLAGAVIVVSIEGVVAWILSFFTS